MARKQSKKRTSSIYRVKSDITTLYPDVGHLRQSLRDFERQFQFGPSAVETVINGRRFRRCFFVVFLLAFLIFSLFSYYTISDNRLVRNVRFQDFEATGERLERKDPRLEFRDIGKEIIPGLEAFFYEPGTKASLNRVGIDSEKVYTNGTECIETVYSWLNDFINNTMKFPNETDPEQMKTVAKMSMLYNNPMVREQFLPWFQEPQSIEHFFIRSRECAAQNHYLVAVACEVVNDPSSYAFDFLPVQNLVASLQLQHHMGIFLQVVTAKAVQDPIFMRELFRHLVVTAWDKTIINAHNRYPKQFVEFVTQKINSVFILMEEILDEREASAQFDRRMVTLWLNIFEAAFVDLKNGEFKDNVLAAMILNFNVNQQYYVESSGIINFFLGKEWADLYISWNLAYVSRFQKNLFFYKLLIPSVLCTADQGDYAEAFMRARVTSLAISLTLSLGGTLDQFHELNAITQEIPVSLMLEHGKINIEQTRLPAPVKSDRIMESMFFRMCPYDCHEGSNIWTFLSALEPEDFESFVQFVLVVTVIMTGLGLELQLGPRMLDAISTKNLAWLWLLAQYLFSFFTLISIISRSVFGIPFLIFGLWKAGFPETVSYVQKASVVFDDRNMFKFLANLADALGTLLHHGASAYVVSALSIGRYQLTQELGSVLIPLVIQHWFVIVKYYSHVLYTIIQFSLEIWWEFEWFRNFHHFNDRKDDLYDVFGPAVALCMVFAHWLYISAFLLRGIHDCRLGNFLHPQDLALRQSRIRIRKSSHDDSSSEPRGERTLTPSIKPSLSLSLFLRKQGEESSLYA